MEASDPSHRRDKSGDYLGGPHALRVLLGGSLRFEFCWPGSFIGGKDTIASLLREVDRRRRDGRRALL